ncbi:hypothetical protein GCM10009122_47550 [Fulvivirga kasyanovii]
MEKVVRIVNTKQAGFDAAYWSKRSSEERINALEHLRTQQLTKNGIRQRLQRVCRVIKRS